MTSVFALRIFTSHTQTSQYQRLECRCSLSLSLLAWGRKFSPVKTKFLLLWRTEFFHAPQSEHQHFWNAISLTQSFPSCLQINLNGNDDEKKPSLRTHIFINISTRTIVSYQRYLGYENSFTSFHAVFDDSDLSPFLLSSTSQLLFFVFAFTLLIMETDWVAYLWSAKRALSIMEMHAHPTLSVIKTINMHKHKHIEFSVSHLSNDQQRHWNFDKNNVKMSDSDKSMSKKSTSRFWEEKRVHIKRSASGEMQNWILRLFSTKYFNLLYTCSLFFPLYSILSLILLY